jgi:hypothetical protein
MGDAIHVSLLCKTCDIYRIVSYILFSASDLMLLIGLEMAMVMVISKSMKSIHTHINQLSARVERHRL